jgi:hypothetical protein
MVFNCSSTLPEPITINSSTPCLTFYHYRGVTKQGYYFECKVIAGEGKSINSEMTTIFPSVYLSTALISFPVAGMAAVLVLCIVGALIIGKVLCCVSGYEDRLPNINFDEFEDQKQILTPSCREPVVSVVQPQPQPPPCERLVRNV